MKKGFPAAAEAGPTRKGEKNESSSVKNRSSSACRRRCSVWLRSNLSSQNFTKELVAHPKTYFSQVRTAADDGGFRVSGKIRLIGSSNAGVPDSVEVALLDTAGRVIETKKVLYIPG